MSWSGLRSAIRFLEPETNCFRLFWKLGMLEIHQTRFLKRNNSEPDRFCKECQRTEIDFIPDKVIVVLLAEWIPRIANKHRMCHVFQRSKNQWHAPQSLGILLIFIFVDLIDLFCQPKSNWIRATRLVNREPKPCPSDQQSQSRQHSKSASQQRSLPWTKTWSQRHATTADSNPRTCKWSQAYRITVIAAAKKLASDQESDPESIDCSHQANRQLHQSSELLFL